MSKKKRDIAKVIKRLEEWQDEGRTITAAELSKICPGWFDN